MSAAALPAPRFPGAAALVVTLWLGFAVIAGATGLLARLPFPGGQLIILGLVALTLTAGSVPGRLRDWIDRLPLRALFGANALRLIGIYFVILGAQGRLNATFAARAGWGDIAAALLAIVLVAMGNPRTSTQRLLYHAWNAFAALDLVVAVGTATIVAAQGITPGMTPLFTGPLSLVPLFFVPLYLANHVFIFRRLVAAGEKHDAR
jgi:hypothetical protein